METARDGIAHLVGADVAVVGTGDGRGDTSLRRIAGFRRADVVVVGAFDEPGEAPRLRVAELLGADVAVVRTGDGRVATSRLRIACVHGADVEVVPAVGRRVLAAVRRAFILCARIVVVAVHADREAPAARDGPVVLARIV